MLAIEMLPAFQGDCLLIQYGSRSVLVDCGIPRAWPALRDRLSTIDTLELLVVTHIDNDHIGGVLKLLDDTTLGLQIRDVWYNAWRHLSDQLGPIEGELVSIQLEQRDLPWNKRFAGRAVGVKASRNPPSKRLPGGLRLTVLGPFQEQLDKLREEWEQVVTEAGLVPGVPSEELAEHAAEHDIQLDLLGDPRDPVREIAEKPLKPDRAPANGSTISLLAEFEGQALLLGGDAHPGVLEDGIRRLLRKRGLEKLPLAAYKVSHHGSAHNTSRSLLELLDCQRYLFSTNGARSRHPHDEAVARVLEYGGERLTLAFNYAQPSRTSFWNDEDVLRAYGATVEYPPDGQSGLRVEL